MRGGGGLVGGGDGLQSAVDDVLGGPDFLLEDSGCRKNAFRHRRGEARVGSVLAGLERYRSVEDIPRRGWRSVGRVGGRAVSGGRGGVEAARSGDAVRRDWAWARGAWAR